MYSDKTREVVALRKTRLRIHGYVVNKHGNSLWLLSNAPYAPRLSFRGAHRSHAFHVAYVR